VNAKDAELEIEFAEAMAARHTAPSEPLFWCGYRRGLRRALYGRRFSTNMVHYAWLDFRKETDSVLAELARGYMAGIEAVVSGKSMRASMQTQTEVAVSMPEPTNEGGRGRETSNEDDRMLESMNEGGSAP